jgi:O-acetyl-ADP-ribose deacetylase (regulator of RNase III)
MIEEIHGDIIDSGCRVVCHGVNTQGVMGAGVARALYTKWPEVKEDYYRWFTEFNAGPEGENFLGSINPVDISPDKTVINCFTQQYYGNGDQLYLSYDALYSCMVQVLMICERHYKVDEIAIPKIGCGLAGGSWHIVKPILEQVFPHDFKVKVYSL